VYRGASGREIAASTGFLMRKPFRLIILIPVYNDWKVAGILLRQLDSVCAAQGLSPAVLLVDDGSAMPAPDDLVFWNPQALCRVEVLELYRNLGHQRAICVAMTHICENFPDAAVLVMDADGEDPADQIPALIEAYLERGERFAIFAERRRRMEGLFFKAFYQFYRLLHILLVGTDIRIGNFSILPPNLVARLVRSSELWSHYAACALKTRLPMATIPIDRGKRLYGESKMNFISLSLHGLSAMSVYSEIIGMRILTLTAALVILGLVGLLAIIVTPYTSPWAVPGWATNMFALTLLLIFQAVIISLLFIFGVLASRGGQAFIPIRDSRQFVLRLRSLFAMPEMMRVAQNGD
jgi:polyisoprenyl-phosphate glycosyltransferase